MPIFSFMYYIVLYSVDINGKQHNPNKYFGVIHLFWSVPTFLEMSFVKWLILVRKITYKR